MANPNQPFTVIEPWKFEAITPGQFVSFNTPNTLNHNRLLHFPLLRVAVLDSPLATAADDYPLIAAMIVPKNRETDWNFCSESGHHQLLFKFQNVSRLILIGNIPPVQGPPVYKRPPVDPLEKQRLENDLKPLLIPFHPKVSSSNNGLRETLFVTEEDDVVYRATVAKLVGPVVGEFLVEDVELVGNTDSNKPLRRRLRFKRMPKVVQSEALLLPIIPDDEATTQTDMESLRNTESAKFEADTTVLVHDYLIPMVAGLSLIASNLNEQIQRGLTPRAFCLGIGGGVLLSFLNTELGFEVAGVEADQMVLTAATEHFGFNKSGSIRLIVGDAIEVIQNFPPQYTDEDTDDSKFEFTVPNVKFDVVFVDLDSSEAKNGFSAPPPEFVKKSVFECLRSIVDDHGVLIINVVHLNEVFYATLIKELKEVFLKVYELDVWNEDNFVVIATTVSKASSIDDDNYFWMKLRSVIPGSYMDSIVEL